MKKKKCYRDREKICYCEECGKLCAHSHNNNDNNINVAHSRNVIHIIFYVTSVICVNLNDNLLPI